MGYLWLLDHGHAPSTPGKRSPVYDDGRLLEWEFARDVVDRVAQQLEALNIAHHIITPRCDFDVGPTDRANIANQVARVVDTPSEARLLSVHANAHGNGADFNEAEGVTVLYYPSSSTGKALAEAMQDCLVTASGMRDRGVKARDNLSLLKKTNMPAILTENGFYTNRQEVEVLASDEGRDMFARAHVNFIASQEGD